MRVFVDMQQITVGSCALVFGEFLQMGFGLLLFSRLVAFSFLGFGCLRFGFILVVDGNIIQVGVGLVGTDDTSVLLLLFFNELLFDH